MAAGTVQDRVEARLLRDVRAMAELLTERPSARARLRAAIGEPLADRLVGTLAQDDKRPQHGRDAA